MPRLAVCPSCQSSGSVPDGVAAKRIRCPKCRTIFEIAGSPEPAPGSAARPPAAPRQLATSTFPDQGPANDSRTTNQHIASTSRAVDPKLLYAMIGVSSLAVVLLSVTLVVVFFRTGPEPKPAVVATAPAPPSTPAAENTPAVPAPEPALAAKAAKVAQPAREPAASAESPASGTTLAALAFGSPKSAEKPAKNSEPQTSIAAASLTPVATLADPLPATPSAPATSAPNPQDVVRKLKDATVYIKSKFGSQLMGTGSGFVIEVSGDSVVIATNRHVAVLDIAEVPASLVKAGGEPRLDVVFRSGLGAQREQTLPAEIMAADPTQDSGTDLAFLRVNGVNQPPKPIDVLHPVDTEEGMRYVGAGFPLGGMLNAISDAKGNPSVTITGGRVAALRRDNYGELNVFQVDGSIQQGNSGGPIIDEISGRLIGVAVAKITSVDTIGFIVPAEEVRKSLAGRVGAVDLALQPTAKPGVASLQVNAKLMDPKGRVKGVVVHAIQATSITTPTASGDGIWPPLPGTPPVELTMAGRGRSAKATGRIEVAVPGQGADARRIWIQTGFRNGSGELVYSRPNEVRLPARPGPIVPPDAMDELVSRYRRPSLALLGTLIDPSKDCRLDKDEDNYRIKIEIPGKTHTLSTDFLNRAGKPLFNAPMALADVNGDFTALVDVVGDISPGTEPPHDRSSRGVPFTYQSAGLVLYQDRNNYLRIERFVSIVGPAVAPVMLHRVVIEAVKDGKPMMPNPIQLNVSRGDVTLAIERRGAKVGCLVRPSGARSAASLPAFSLDLPAKTRVGLLASNISAKPFSATFGDFVLITDLNKLKADPGRD